MKTITLFLLLFVATTFAQMTKVETHEPSRTNYVEENGNFKASTDVYPDYVEIKFFDKGTGDVVSVSFTPAEYEQLTTRLLTYDNRDKDFYMMPIKRATLYIRFVEKYGYVQAIIHFNFDSQDWYFPIMNRIQYKRLFAAN